MALKDTVVLGMSLPHRSPDRIDESAVRQVAQRAEALGFRDLWVTNNTVDETGCFDSLTVLTYAAALTTTIRLGVSVLVLPIYHPIHVAHQWPPWTISAAAGHPGRRARARPRLPAVPGTRASVASAG